LTGLKIVISEHPAKEVSSPQIESQSAHPITSTTENALDEHKTEKEEKKEAKQDEKTHEEEEMELMRKEYAARRLADLGAGEFV
jgi:hypothetical protein